MDGGHRHSFRRRSPHEPNFNGGAAATAPGDSRGTSPHNVQHLARIGDTAETQIDILGEDGSPSCEGASCTRTSPHNTARWAAHHLGYTSARHVSAGSVSLPATSTSTLPVLDAVKSIGTSARLRGGGNDSLNQARDEADAAELHAVPPAWLDCFHRAKPSWALRSAQARHLAAISEEADVYCVAATGTVKSASYLVPAGADADATIASGAPALQELKPIDLVVVPLTSMGPGIEAEANTFFLAVCAASWKAHNGAVSRRFHPRAVYVDRAGTQPSGSAAAAAGTSSGAGAPAGQRRRCNAGHTLEFGKGRLASCDVRGEHCTQ